MHQKHVAHVILEIGRRFGITDVYIIGSAAILAVLPDPSEGELTATRDIDVIPPYDEEHLADQISWVLGEATDFDDEHGYYVQGVTSKTPRYAPRDWMLRTIPVRVQEFTGRCMEAHDLVLSKLGAAREKDLPFAKAAAKLGLVQREQLLTLLGQVDCNGEDRRRITASINAIFV